MNKGHLYVLAAPSGAGKTSLAKAIVSADSGVVLSVSYTTRPKRPSEQNDMDYHFVTEGEFKKMIADNVFLEHAVVFDHLYGTSRAWVEQKLNQGLDVILEIDWQGAQQIRKNMPESVGIFILPPSRDALRERLHKRQEDSEEVIAQRLQEAKSELEHHHEFDHKVVNENFDEALADIQAIISANREDKTPQLKMPREDLIEELLS